MLFLPCLKLNVHLHLSKFKGFLSSQHVVKDALMKMMETGSLISLSLCPHSLYAVDQTDCEASSFHCSERC